MGVVNLHNYSPNIIRALEILNDVENAKIFKMLKVLAVAPADVTSAIFALEKEVQDFCSYANQTEKSVFFDVEDGVVFLGEREFKLNIAIAAATILGYSSTEENYDQFYKTSSFVLNFTTR